MKLLHIILLSFFFVSCSVFPSSEENTNPSFLTSEFSETKSYGNAKIGDTYHTLDHFQFQVEERDRNYSSSIFSIYSGTQDVNASPFYSFVFQYLFYENDISSDTLLKFPEHLTEDRSTPPFWMIVYSFDDFNSYVEDSLWVYRSVNNIYPDLEVEIDFLEDESGIDITFDGFIVKDNIVDPISTNSIETFYATYKLKFK